jgi:sugar lactone lactonase YvrE
MPSVPRDDIVGSHMELRLRWPKMRKWGAAGALLTLGLLACRQPLPPPTNTDTSRKMDGSVERPRPMPDSGSSELDTAVGPGDDAGGDVTDGGAGEVPVDGAVTETAGDLPADVPGVDLGPAPGNCGLGRPDLAMVTATSAVAVARDGTLYFAQAMGTDGFIGRLRPSGPAAMALSLRLVRIPNGARLSGLAIDNMRNVLYVASASRGAVHRINLNANPPTSSDLIIGLQPNDLIWNGGTDGNLYYSEQSDRRIYRLSPIGMRTQVTPTALTDVPAGLAFGPGGGDLFVGSATAGPITRIAMTAGQGVEQSRTRYGSYNGVGEGLAFDGVGRLYVTAYAASGDSQVVRLDAFGNNPATVATGGQLSSLTFGQGGLDCRDLYVTSRPGAMLRLPVDFPGAQ